MIGKISRILTEGMGKAPWLRLCLGERDGWGDNSSLFRVTCKLEAREHSSFFPWSSYVTSSLHLPSSQSNYYQHSKFVKLIPSEITLGGSKDAFLIPLQTRSEI